MQCDKQCKIVRKKSLERLMRWFIVIFVTFDLSGSRDHVIFSQNSAFWLDRSTNGILFTHNHREKSKYFGRNSNIKELNQTSFPIKGEMKRFEMNYSNATYFSGNLSSPVLIKYFILRKNCHKKQSCPPPKGKKVQIQNHPQDKEDNSDVCGCRWLLFSLIYYRGCNSPYRKSLLCENKNIDLAAATAALRAPFFARSLQAAEVPFPGSARHFTIMSLNRERSLMLC